MASERIDRQSEIRNPRNRWEGPDLARPWATRLKSVGPDCINDHRNRGPAQPKAVALDDSNWWTMAFLAFVSFLLAAHSRVGGPSVDRQVSKRYHVLLIGVPEPNGTLFGKLDAVQGDLEALAKVLEDNWHVPKGAVVIEIAHGKTTKQGIVDLINKDLVQPCKDQNDVVYFGFSGHGYQVFDESKPTKQSQAIVPADVRYLSKDDEKRGLKAGEVEPESLLTGPEIGKLFDALKNVTENVTLTFDSCHSGSITRGTFKARGRNNPAINRYLARGGTLNSQSLAHEFKGRGLVCLSAAAPDQLAWEVGDSGVFTRALVGALQNPGNGERTYQSLFNQIKAMMATISEESPHLPAKQDPQPEGDLNRKVLGNEFVAPKNSMEVHVVGNQPVMGGGRVVGMKPGFLVGIYPEGSDNFDGDPKWKAVIADGGVRTGESDLRVTDYFDGKDWQKASENGSLPPAFALPSANAQAIVLDGKPDGSIRVYTGDLPPDLRIALEAKLKHSPIVDPTAPANAFDYRIVPGASPQPGGAHQWELVSGAEGLVPKPVETFATSGSVEAQAADLAEKLQSVARRNAVLALEPDEKPQTLVEMQLIPATVKDSVVIRIDPDHPIRAGQTGTEAMTFAIRVRLVATGGSAPPLETFISLLNVNPHPVSRPPAGKDPGRSVEQLWPRFDANGAISAASALRKLSVEKGWQYLGDNNELVSGNKPSDLAAWNVDADTDGLGQELFKVFATDQDENFAPLLDRTRSARGSSSTLGRTLGSFAKMEPRSRGNPKTKGPATQHWCTTSIMLTVVPNPK